MSQLLINPFVHKPTLLTGLVSHWTLEEASGTRNDSHGTNHLSDINTVTQAVGKIGNAAQFTRANSEHLRRSSNASLQTGMIDFTFAAWVYFDSLSASESNCIASKFNGGSNLTKEWTIQYSASLNKILFRVCHASDGTNDEVLWGTAPSLATWYYLVAWRDIAAGTINIQLNNGTLVSKAVTVASGATLGAYAIGHREEDGGTDFFNGRIDEVSFWKRLLTATERTTLYNSGSGAAYPFTGIGGGG